MTILIFYLLGLAPGVAGSGMDVTNNLFSDIGPLLALFGEKFAQQFLQESLTWLDHIIFAMAPLGIITAVVGAIRVGGPPWLKAVIGRARENRSSVELEFMSSTSHEVCELWNGDGIIRMTGKGLVKQIIYLEGCGNPETECFLFTLTEAEKEGQKYMKKEGYRGALFKRLFAKEKVAPAHDDRQDRAPNISLNLHSKQKTWELLATAAAGVVLQSGVLVFSGFVAYNTRFGDRVGGRPSPYAYPVLLSGTVALTFGMWICALVIGESTEEFEWRMTPEPHAGDLDKSEKGHLPPNSEKAVKTAITAKSAKTPKTDKPTFRVFWVQKRVFVGDQSFDSCILMAKGTKEIILTSYRNNDPVSPEEAQNTGRTEGLTDTSISHNILCIIGTLLSITGFILQFEGFRGISWACSIAQLVSIIIMAVLRATVRRGMLDSPATVKITPEYEMDWLSLKLGFDGDYLKSLSSPQKPKNPCLSYGKELSSLVCKETPNSRFKLPEGPCWKVCNKLGSPTRAEWYESPKHLDRKKSIVDSARPSRPGYPLLRASSDHSLKSHEPLKAKETEAAVKEQEKNDSLQVHAVVNIRKRLGYLTTWEAPSSVYAASIAKAIQSVLNLTGLGAKTTFIWYVDVQFAEAKSGQKRLGKLRLVANNKGTQEEPSWTTPKEDIYAILSLWMYHFKDKNQWGPEEIEEHRLRSLFEKSEPTRTPFRRVLGPDSEVLKADLAWWAGEVVVNALQTFSWEKPDTLLSLGYGYQKRRIAREAGNPPTCCAMVTNVSMERFLAQHFFSAFMWEIADHIPVLESATTVDLQSQSKFDPQLPKWSSLRLVNQTIQEMAKAVEGSALATLEDAYTLIIPPLSAANKLPSEALVEMVRQKAIENHQDYQLDKAYELYLQLLILCDDKLLLNEKFVYKSVATAVDFLMTTDSVTVTDEGVAGDSDPQLREAKSALINKITTTNLKTISIKLIDLFKKQKRHNGYKSMLPSKDEDEKDDQMEQTSQKPKKKDIRPAQAFGTEFGYTALHNDIFSTKSNVDRDCESWRYLKTTDILGWTPLHYAVIYRPEVALAMLSEDSALARRPNLAGWTPLHYTVMNHSDDGKTPATTDSNIDDIKLKLVAQLLKAYGGADLGIDGILPLHLAAASGNEKVVTALLNSPLHRKKISAENYWGMTPLHFAAIKGKDKIVKLLLDRAAKINAQDKFDRTALHLAVEKIQATVVTSLLERDDENVNKMKDKSGRTALQIAAAMERDVNDKLVKAKANKASLMNKWKKENSLKKPIDDNTPVSGKGDAKNAEIAASGRVGILSTSKLGDGIINDAAPVKIDELPEKERNTDVEVQKGESSKAPNKAAKPKERKSRQKLSKNLEDLETTFEQLSKESKNLQKIIEKLLSKEDLAAEGGKLLLWAARERLNTTFKFLISKREVEHDKKDPYTGQSALHFAAKVGSEGMVQLLLHKWTPKMVNARDCTGTTVLILAAISGYSKIVDLLLDAGADQMILDDEERLAISWAVEKGQVAIVKRLLDSDNAFCMNPNAVDGNPPRLLLARAAEKGNLAMVKLLFSKGAKLDQKNSRDHSPMYWAVSSGHPDIVELFLKTTPKPDVDELNEISNPPSTLLAVAIDADQLNITKQLLKAGADVRKKSGKYQQTPLSFAVNSNRLMFVTLLLDNPDNPDHYADTEEVDRDGWTPLLFAICGGHRETVKLLISKGSCARISNNGEKSDLSLAIDYGDDEMVSEVLKNRRGKRSQPHLDKAILWAAERGNNELVELLLDKNASPDAKCIRRSTPLLKAAKGGHVDTVRLLLKWKADANLSNEKGETPLYWASYNGFEDIVVALLEKFEGKTRADPNIRTASNSTALLAAAEQGQEAVADMLLKAGAKINVNNDRNETPLYWACSNGLLSMVQTFLELEAEPNIVSNHDSTPLLQAIESENTAIVELLLNKKANFAVANPKVCSALILASSMGETEVVRKLLALGADIKVQDQDLNTPLHQAALNGQLEVLILLLDLGADPEAKNKNLKSPLHYAAEAGHVEIAEYLLTKTNRLDEEDENGRTPLSLASEGGHDDVIELLCSKKARPNSKDKNLKSPISWAANEGEEATVKLLAKWGAEIESKDIDKRTPLSWAVSQENIAAANVLLAMGAEVNCKDSKGRTPLSWAASGYQDYMAKRLLEAEADVMSLDNDGRNPLSWAVSERNEEMVRLLLQHKSNDQIAAQEHPESGGQTVLHRAVETGDVDIVGLILKAKPNVNKADNIKETPLGLAARNPNQDVIFQLLEADAVPNVQDSLGRTPFFSAICLEHDLAALEMLDKDLDTEKHPHFSRTPLQEAIWQYSYDIVDKLLTRGANVASKDTQGRDAFHVAAARGMDHLQLLVDKGLDRKAQFPITYDLQHRHALHHAACSQKISVVNYLLDRYKRPTETTASKSQPDHEWRKILGPDNDGWTPLHWAAKAGDIDVVQRFLDIGADATLKENLNKWTPVQIAQFHEQNSVVVNLRQHLESLGVESSNEEVILPGKVDDTRECDGCGIYPIYGILYSCTICENFDFCYKCKYSSDKTHPDHKFKQEPEPEEES